MRKAAGLFLSVIAFAGCATSKSASYRYAQKQLARGDLNFEDRLRVDEYVNAFPQHELAKPSAGEDLAVSVDFFTDGLPPGSKATLAQVAVRTREANEVEKARKLGICMVLDLSGSMDSDNKLRDSLEALKAMVAELRTGTEFGLVVFSNDARVEIEPVAVSGLNREALQAQISQLGTEGGTNIESGLVEGYRAMTKYSADAQTRLLLLTDGMSNVGVTDPKEIAAKARVQYLEGARISTIGLGYDVDENLLRKIAEQGRGAFYFAENAAALKDILIKDVNSLMIPVVKDASVTITASQGAKIKRVYGYESGLEGSTFKTEVGELNSDDWRIYVLEIESDGAGQPNIAVSATANFTPAGGGQSTSKMGAASMTALSEGSKVQVNKVVARNAVLFSNALALIKISQLDKEGEYTSAEEIANVQIASLEAVRSLDDSPQLAKEVGNMRRVKRILRERKTGEKLPEASEADGEYKDPSRLRSLVRGALQIAEELVPGPWSYVLRLIGIVFD